jgi:hypothetical protein
VADGAIMPSWWRRFLSSGCRRMKSGDAAKSCRPADTVLTKTASRIAASIESRYHIAMKIDDLRVGIYPDARIGVVKRRRVCQAAKKGGVAILYIGVGLLKSASTPESTKELYRSTV